MPTSKGREEKAGRGRGREGRAVERKKGERKGGRSKEWRGGGEEMGGNGVNLPKLGILKPPMSTRLSGIPAIFHTGLPLG